MCGRSVLTLEPQDIQARTNTTRVIGQYQQSYNVTIGMVQPVIVASANQHVVQAMTWGGVTIGTQMGLSNIRSDNKNGLFKSMLKKQRCLVVANGFYEWKHPTHGNSKPLPYYFHIPNQEEKTKTTSSSLSSSDSMMISESDRFGGNEKIIDKSKTIMLMAGVYQVTKDNGGNDSYRYSVITTDASKEVSPVHHRMPVIFRDQDDINRWLSESTTDEESYGMMKQFIGLSSHRVPMLVNSIKNNGPELIENEKDYYSKHGINRFFQPIQDVQQSQQDVQQSQQPIEQQNNVQIQPTILDEEVEFDFFDDTPPPSSSSSSTISQPSFVNTQISSSSSSSSSQSKPRANSNTTTKKPTVSKSPSKSPSKSTLLANKKSFTNPPKGGGIERFFTPQ
ncbi:hypothetical protein DFA_08775 [Cavenderia fasciculata]|uniref:DUF159 family protein n=1 Tax=Cavenderia fasciculata TaxID=261658 RepID=F4Q474_CACFS|nr:uncharacterized protein DFA_08775 [Cavenderia fasciculata]EGG17776.1 hypothetical protein DFA_08775 [Cavenderia fasciculata]|eukprot:XP_004356260.1 hypothetical protein DFA_08775 [Cavenderia fasciculata]